MKSNAVLYVKFDLTREAVAAFPELAHAAREEGAIRVSLISRCAADRLQNADQVALHPAQSYVVLKAPTLDGTELWIVAQERQAYFEKQLGWEKLSTPLLRFEAARLSGWKARHPYLDREVPVSFSETISNSGTGVEQISFSEGGASQVSVVSLLEEAGTLVCREAAA